MACCKCLCAIARKAPVPVPVSSDRNSSAWSDRGQRPRWSLAAAAED
jgi:hypothetical protein